MCQVKYISPGTFKFLLVNKFVLKLEYKQVSINSSFINEELKNSWWRRRESNPHPRVATSEIYTLSPSA